MKKRGLIHPWERHRGELFVPRISTSQSSTCGNFYPKFCWLLSSPRPYPLLYQPKCSKTTLRFFVVVKNIGTKLVWLKCQILRILSKGRWKKQQSQFYYHTAHCILYWHYVITLMSSTWVSVPPSCVLLLLLRLSVFFGLFHPSILHLGFT